MGALRRGCTAAVWSFIAVACGPDVAEPLVCDGDGPLPLLALDDDEDEGRVAFTVRDGAGWLAVVGDRGLALECGEAAREFVRDVSDGLREVADADVRWLAFRPKPSTIPGGARVAVDPWGTRDAFELPGEVVGTLDGAFVTVGDVDLGVRITSLPRDGEPGEHEVSYELPAPEESVRHWDQPRFSHPFERVDRVFGLSFGSFGSRQPAVGIDLRTGEVEVLGSEVGELYVHAHGRFVVLVPRDETAPTRLVNRETGRALTVGEPGWSIRPGSADPGLVIARDYGELPEVRSHLIFLPSLEELWLEGEAESEPYWITDDGRRLIETEEGLFIAEPGDAAPTLLYPGRGPACDVGDDVYLWDHGLYEGDEAVQGPWDRLVRIPLEGSPPQVVIEGPLTWAAPLSDGRWVISREWSESDLLLHDPRTGTDELLAADVERVFVDPRPQTSWDVCPAWSSADELHDEVRWVARDPEDGDRKLWRFAL